jgi:response regulator RpfG family c-di-GMP phosphodiesterase
MPRWRDDGRPIALLIVDQKMPQMTGVELLTALRESASKNAAAAPVDNARAILITGYAGLESAVASRNLARVDRYLEKPWDRDELATEIETLLMEYLDDSEYGVFFGFRETSDQAEVVAAVALRHEVSRGSPPRPRSGDRV